MKPCNKSGCGEAVPDARVLAVCDTHVSMYRRSQDKLFSQRLKMHDGMRVVIDTYEKRDGTYSSTGHTRLDVGVRAALPGKPLLTIWKLGDAYCGVSRYSSIDGDSSKALVLSLVAMKPGDTDADYFAGWNRVQLAFAEKYGEEIGMIREERFGDL